MGCSEDGMDGWLFRGWDGCSEDGMGCSEDGVDGCSEDGMAVQRMGWLFRVWDGWLFRGWDGWLFRGWDGWLFRGWDGCSEDGMCCSEDGMDGSSTRRGSRGCRARVHVVTATGE